MKARRVMDKKGRITIPKFLRETLHLGAGDVLPSHSRARTTSGVTTGEPLSPSTTNDLLLQIRGERDLSNFGAGSREIGE